MIKKTTNKQIVILVFLLMILTSSNIFLANSLGKIIIQKKVSTTAVGLFTESFENTTYRAPTTNAFGWGTGTLTNARNITLSQLDFYATKSPLTGIAVQGRKAYAVGFNRTSTVDSVLAFNINEPNNIRLTSTRNSLTNLFSCEISGDTFYGGTIETKHFVRYNVTYPYSLDGSNVYMGYIGVGGYVTDLAIEGPFVYLATYGGTGLKIINVENPLLAYQITTTFVSSNILGLTVSGHYAYLATSTDGLYILNVTNKYAPSVLGHLALPGNATDVILDGKFAYVSLAEEGVALVDIREPTAPQLLDVAYFGGIASRMALQGNTLFVANGPGGIAVLDVADHNRLAVILQHPFSYVWDVDLYGGVVVVGTEDGLYTYQISAIGGGITDIGKTVYANAFTDLEAWDVRVVGDIAYIAGGKDGFYTLNIRDPNNPILLDHIPINPNSAPPLQCLDVQGQFAVATSKDRILLFDIQDPSNIVLVGNLSGVLLGDPFFDGPFLYISWQLGGFGLINLTTASMLSWVYKLDEPHFGSNTTAIWAQGYRIYAVDYSGAIQSSIFIFDRLDPTNIKQTDEATLWGLNLDLKVDGDLAYHSDTNWCVISNVSDPTNRYYVLDLKNNTNNYIPSTAVWNFGPYVLSASPSGTYMVNTINFTALHSSSYANTQAAQAITTSGDYTYIANRSSLIILRHFESAGDTYVDEINQAESTTLTSLPNGTITSVTLDFNGWVPDGCTLDFFVSADGGTHWESVMPGISHTIINNGLELRWRVEFDGDTDRSAHLHQVIISYEYEYERITPSSTTFLSPLWIYIIAGGGGGLLLIIIIIVIAVFVSKKKKRTPTR